jgi:hypothetical protein
MESLVFENMNFNFFRKFPGFKRSKFFFRRILVKSIAFDAEFDVGEGYVVLLIMFAFILVQIAIFWKKDEIP